MSHRSRPGKSRDGSLPRGVQVSKKLSWLLRHGAKQEGIAMRGDGYVNVQDVLTNRKIRGLQVTFEEIQEIVRDNDKQRFAMISAAQLDEKNSDNTPTGDTEESVITQEPVISSSQEPREWLIRATQGHSIKLDSTATLLTPITADNLPLQAVHGTTHSAWPLIVATGGLKPMTRNHVHLATGLPSGFTTLEDASGKVSAPVISGMRNTSTILIYIDMLRAIQKGNIEFGLSENGVVLTEGNADGILPIQFFERVEDRTGQGILVENGVIVKEAPAAWGKARKKG